jgi:hypothetical protein
MDAQRHTETRSDTQRHTETLTETRRATERHRDTLSHTDTGTNRDKHTPTHKDTQRRTVAYTGAHGHTETQSGTGTHTQRHKDTVMRRSMQRHAETRRRLLIGNCWPMLMRLHACRGKPVSVPSNPCAHRSNARGLWRSQCFRACHLLQMAGQRDITCLEACMCLRVWLGI